MGKIGWIRTGLLLLVLIFAVLGGNFLYTGDENESPLDRADAVFLLEEQTVLTETFAPVHRRLTAVAVALQAPADGEGMSGDLTVTLSVHETGAVVYADTVSLEGMPDKWYVDLPVKASLDTDILYDIAFSVEHCSGSGCPSLYLVPLSAQIPEMAGSVNTTGAAVFPEGKSAAVRLSYDVLVPARLAAFLALIMGILLCTGGIVWYFRKKQGESRTPGELLGMEIGRVPLIHLLLFLAVTIAAVILRVVFLPVKSNDYYLAYEVWINEIRNNGGIASLGKNIGDYPPLHMTLITLLSYLPFEPVVIIKLPSCIFDFILAVVSVKLLGQLGVTEIGRKLTLYAVILLNPLTLLDSAAWGQCDSLYGSFVLLTLLAVCSAGLCHSVPAGGEQGMPEKSSEALGGCLRRSRGMYGNGRGQSTEGIQGGKTGFWNSGDGIGLLFAIAISLKLQAVFFLPVLCFIWIMQKRNVLKPALLLWVPIVYTISCIPMYLAGRSLKVMFKIYLGQANRNYGTLTMNYPNLYNLIGAKSEVLYEGYFVYGIMLALLLLLLLYYQLYCRKVELDSLMLCKVSALSIFTVCFCMPLIHERYAFVAEMLLFVVMIKDAKYIKIACITMLCTLFTYCSYLQQLERSFSVLPEWAIALVRLGVLFYMVKDIFSENRQETGIQP